MGLFNTLVLSLLLAAASGSSFEEWVLGHNKVYATKPEYRLRKDIWLDNVRYIEDFNDRHRNRRHQLAVNQFADKTHSEYRALLTAHKHTFAGHPTTTSITEDPPKSKDWREDNVVAPVQNQGDCGSCYVFSAVSVTESMYAIKSGQLVKLSEQQVVDCSQPWGNAGCDGGTPYNVFDYYHDKGAIPADKYPNIKDGKCHANYSEVVVKVKDVVKIKKYSEKELQKAVGLVGPVSVSIDAGERDFMFYTGGVYYNPMCISARIDHAVVIVGYGSEAGKDFWIVRNSWGPNWGLNGYIKLARNKQNMCGVATMAVYPTVAGSS